MMLNGLNSARARLGAIVRNSVALAMLASSGASAAVTALVILVMLPSAVDAQVTRLTGSSLTVMGSDSRPGMTAEVGPPGGGILRVFGTDGKTIRL
jgi:hypothetical protein